MSRTWGSPGVSVGLKSSNSVIVFEGVVCSLSTSSLGDSGCSTSPLNIRLSSAAAGSVT